MSMSSLLESFTISLPARGVSKQLRAAVRTKDAVSLDTIFCNELRRVNSRLLKLVPKDCLLFMWSVDSVALSGRERELAASIEESCDHFQSLAKGQTEVRSKNKEEVKGKKKKKNGARLKQRGTAKQSSAVHQVRELIANWLVEATCHLGSWELLAICEMLIRWGHQLDSDLRLRCLALLMEQHEIRPQAEIEPGIWGESGDEPSRLKYVQPLVAVESQMLVSFLVRPFINDTVTRKESMSVLSQTLMDCTDEEGLVQGAVLSVVPFLFASWTRLMVWGQVFEQTIGPKKIQTRFKTTVEKLSMLLMPAGQLATPREAVSDQPSNAVTPVDCALMIKIAGRVSGCRTGGKVQRLAAEIVKGQLNPEIRAEQIKRLKVGRKCSVSRKSTQAWQSDTSSVAMMRSSADCMADVCSVEWSGNTIQVLLAPIGIPVVTGGWQSSATVDGQPVHPDTTWECTCWYTDEEAAFIELEMQTSAATFVRHVLLSTVERFAILTDSVRGSNPESEVVVQSTLQLAPQCSVDRDAVTRELQITSQDVRVRVFPLWLPDDRIEHAHGEMSERDDRLEYSLSSAGAATLPCVLDWHPQRSQQPADWTRLTVAESRRIVSNYEATGYRLRIGKHQIMAYLSVMKPELNRTVLGVHTADESFYGRVAKSGDLEPFVQVESRPDAVEESED